MKLNDGMNTAVPNGSNDRLERARLFMLLLLIGIVVGVIYMIRQRQRRR